MKFLVKIYPILLLLSAFGPYVSLSLGVKVDNLLIFPLGLLFILTLFLQKRIKVHTNFYSLVISWALLFGFLLIRTLAEGSFNPVTLLAEIKNFAQPLLILLFFTVVYVNRTTEDANNHLLTLCKVLIGLLAVNTLWIFAGITFNLDAINHYFWRGENSVASLAAQNGRFSGVFNQPIEAGIAYTVGIFSWIYIVEQGKKKTTFFSIILLILLIVGGSMTVSKVFVLFGMGVFVFSGLALKSMRKQFFKVVLAFLLIGIPVYQYLVNSWTGLNYLMRLYDADNYQSIGFLTLLTAGRFGGDDSQQSSFFGEIWRDAPIIGEGLGSQGVYDSAFFHVFSSGGLIGLGIYIVFLLALVWKAYEYFVYRKFAPEAKFFYAMVILVILGGLGAPIMTLNRSSIIVWVFLGILLQHLSQHRVEEKDKLTSA